MSVDWTGVDCTTAREAMSARLDGELSAVMDEALDLHLAGCSSCARAATGLADLTRRSRLRAAPEMPDLSDAVVRRVQMRARWSVARVGLVVVVLSQVALTLPLLARGGHSGREAGVTELALAVGLLAAAWRPWRAAGMVPVVAALALGLAVLSAVEIAAGAVGPVDEAPHLLPLIGLALLWRLRHRDPLAPRPPAARAHHASWRRSA
jgi:predicted anti-sigma-YlaC factor YlaD